MDQMKDKVSRTRMKYKVMQRIDQHLGVFRSNICSTRSVFTPEVGIID